MALEESTISIPLAEGIDTKNDSKQVDHGKLLAVQNGTFKNPKELSPRNGFDQLSTTGITAGNSLANFGSSLLELDGQKVYERSETNNSFQSVGNKVAVSFSAASVVATNTSQSVQDIAYLGNYALYAWESTSGGVRYSIIDTQSNSVVLNNVLAGSGYVLPRCTALGTKLTLWVYNPTTKVIDYFSFSTASITATVNAVTLFTTTSTFTMWDVISANSAYYLVYQNSSTVMRLSLVSSVYASTTNADTTIATPLLPVTVVAGSNGNIWLAFKDGSNTLKYKVYDSTIVTTILAATTIDSALNANSVTMAENATNSMQVFYDVAATAFQVNTGYTNNNYYVNTALANTAGTVSSKSILLRSIGLASKAFTVSGVIYFFSVHDSFLQPTYFLINSSTSSVAGKIAPNVAGGIPSKQMLPNIVSVSATSIYFPYLKKTIETTVNGAITALVGVWSSLWDFTYSVGQLQLASNTLLDGGMESMFDGQSVVEHNFNLYPEILTLDGAISVAPGTTGAPSFFTLTASAWLVGGGMAQGVYSYLATYEWIDSQGNLHRSAPSPQGLTVHMDATLTMNASITNTSKVLTIVAGGNINSALSIINGFKIVGAGIPTFTFIDNLINTTSLNMTLAATATTNPVALTLVPSYYIYPNTTPTGNPMINVFQLANQLACYSPTNTFISAAANTGSSVVTVSESRGLFVGMTIVSPVGGGTLNAKITAINGNQVTIDTPTSGVITNTAVTVSMSSTNAGFTNGSPVVTNISANFSNATTVDPMGAFVYTPNGIYSVLKKDPIAGTITLTTNYGGTTGAGTINLGLKFSSFLRVGMVLSDKNGVTMTIKNFVFSTGFDTIVTDSMPPTIDLTGGLGIAGSLATLVDVDTLRLTEKSKSTNPVKIVLYRTLANGTVYRRTASLISAINNVTTQDSLAIIDSTPDGELSSNELLYTTGGEVENLAAPANTIKTQFKNRAIVVDSENKLEWWYSKQVLPGFPVEFSDLFIQNIDQRGGDITAVGVMDDKLIFFKSDNIFYVIGDGPAPSGANNDFSYPQLIATDTGCIDSNSVVVTPQGIMYKSRKGIYILGRGLEASYIGAPVEFYNQYSVNSAQLVPDTTRVRFVLDNNTGLALEWDYLVQQWSVFTNFTSVASTIYQNLFTYVKSDGSVWKENKTSFVDGTSAIVMSFTTSWIQVAKVQGFERVRRLLILGDWKSNHTLKVEVAYDFDPTIVQTETITATSSVTPEQYRIHLARQKCQAVQFTLTMTPTATLGEGMRISNLALEIGIKKGLNKMPASKSYG